MKDAKRITLYILKIVLPRKRQQSHVDIMEVVQYARVYTYIYIYIHIHNIYIFLPSFLLNTESQSKLDMSEGREILQSN